MINQIFVLIELLLLATSAFIAVLWIRSPGGSYEPVLAGCAVLLSILEFVRRRRLSATSSRSGQHLRKIDPSMSLELVDPGEARPGSLIGIDRGFLRFHEKFKIPVKGGRIRLENQGAPVSVRISLESISAVDADYPFKTAESELKLFNPEKARFNNPHKVANPYRLESDESVDLDFSGTITVDTEEVERVCGASIRLQALAVHLKAEGVGQTPLTRKLVFSLGTFHKHMEQMIAKDMPFLWRNREGPPASQVLAVLKRYWAGPIGSLVEEEEQ